MMSCLAPPSCGGGQLNAAAPRMRGSGDPELYAECGARSPPQKSPCSPLGEVRPGQDRLGVLQALNLVRASLLASTVVLHEEVAAGVQAGDVPRELRKRLRRRRMLRLRVLDLLRPLRTRALLLRDALRVLRAGLLAGRHQVLVVLLRRLLLVLGLGVLSLQLLDHVVHELHHAVALPVLLLVRAERLRRRRRNRVRRRTDLREHRDASPRNASLRRRGLLRVARVHTARRNEDALLLRQLTALRGLVQVRAVELVQLVLRRLHQLRRRLVLGLRLDEGRVLLLALLRGLGNRLVEGLDLGLKSLDLARKRRHRRRHLLNGRRKARNRLLRVLLLRRRLLELSVAEVLLRVIIGLLLAKHVDHAVNLRRHLREIHGLALQRRRNQAQLRLVRAAHLRKRHQHALRAKHVRRLRALLQEAHARLAERRRRLLEEVQRVVIVQDLDRLADRIHLLRAHRLALAPGRLLRRALLAQIGKESLRLSNVRLRVLHVVLRLDDLNRDLAGTLRLGLNRRRRRRNLRILRRREIAEGLRRGSLVRRRRLQVTLHLLKHRLQHARDLARRLRGLLALEEIQHALTLEIIHLARLRHNALHTALLLRAHLQERAHALLQSSDGTLHRPDVGRHVSGRLLELSLLLRTDVRRLLRVLLGGLTGRLVLAELLVQLSLLRLQGLQLRAEFRRLLRSCLGARLHAIGIAVTVAHELVESLLLLLTLGLDLLLHVLQQGDDPPDRVLRFAQAESSHRAPAACEQKRQREESHLALAPRSVLTVKSQQTLEP